MRRWIKTGLLTTLLALCLAPLTGCGREEESYRLIEVMELEGKATVDREETGQLDAYENMRLESGDHVSVADNSSMILNLDDDKYVLLESGTRMDLVAEGTKENSRTTIHLQEGAVLNHLTQKLSEGSSYEVTAPNSTMAVRGTVFPVEVRYDENGESYTYVTVLEGVVGTRLIFPDGTVEPLEKERQIPMGMQVNIRGDAEVSEYYPYEMTEIDFERFSLEALEFLKSCIERGAELSVTEEEIDDWIKILYGEPEEDEPEEEAEEDLVEDLVEEEPGAEAALPELILPVEITQQPVYTAPENSGAASSGGSSGNSSGSETDEEATEETTEETTETCTVEFTSGGTLFYTVTVESGSMVSEPSLCPTASGHWDYDFGTAVTENTTIRWVEE